MPALLQQRDVRLYLLIGGFFITCALTAEFIGVKIFSLEGTLGFRPFEWKLFGVGGTLQFTCGVMLWPVVFVVTDLINEYYGRKGVRFLSYLTAGMITFAFLMVFLAVRTQPADFWVGTFKDQNVPDLQAAFGAIMGQTSWIIVGSLIAFLLGQIIDAFIFHRVKKITGEKRLWLRATGSTFISQFIDSFVVLYVAFVLGPQKWGLDLFLAVGTVNFIYKIFAALALTPVIYFVHGRIEAYLGKELAADMKRRAMGEA